MISTTAQSEAALSLPVPLPTGEAAMAKANELGVKNCVVCHGMHGEGNAIRLDLTDNYFIHGGGPEYIYTVISEDVAVKDMQSWK